MIFLDPELNQPNQIIHLFEYHPYRKGLNPDFDEISSKILDLKNNKNDAIRFFYKKLNPLLSTGFHIAVVPSHHPGTYFTGICKVAKILIRKQRFDATYCLERHTKIDKLSKGGDRSIAQHLTSIHVVKAEIIHGKEVLLLDDVTTTGNSLKACRHLLLNAGARYVQCLALAQTVG